jgi:ABC-type sugar transport system substrate-binding protein
VLHSIRKLRTRGRIALATGGVAVVAAGAAFGTVGTTAASAKGGCIKMLLEFKLQGLSVFEANLKGADEYASKFNICKPSYGGPATASATGQVSDIQAAIAAHVKVIAMTSDDPQVPVAALQSAMKAGIKVVTFDSDVPTARNFFIQDTAYNTIAQGVIKAAVKFAGPTSTIGIMSSTPDATIQLAWIGAMESYVKSTYPQLNGGNFGQIIAYGQSVTSTSLTAATSMIQANPGIKAILPIDGAAVVGTAEAVAQLNDSGKIGVFGIGDPLPNATYFANGSMQGLFLWNEVGQGALIDCVSELAVENKIKAGSTFSCPGVPWKSLNAPGKWTVAKSPNTTTGATKNTIIFSGPLEFTPSNYTQYKF